jgi:hypothetical protein
MTFFCSSDNTGGNSLEVETRKGPSSKSQDLDQGIRKKPAHHAVALNPGIPHKSTKEENVLEVHDVFSWKGENRKSFYG